MSEQPRPAYVTFETRAVEDRDASIEAGRFVTKDVIFAVVTPAGTKDRLEKIAEEWLENVREGVAQERIPEVWLHAYTDKFERFKKSQEMPEDGTPIKGWTLLSPAQVQNILAANILTVEDLADATEEAISRIGMGARELREKARAYLATANDTGKVASELEALRTANNDLQERNKSLEENLKTLQAEVEVLKAAKK